MTLNCIVTENVPSKITLPYTTRQGDITGGNANQQSVLEFKSNQTERAKEGQTANTTWSQLKVQLLRKTVGIIRMSETKANTDTFFKMTFSMFSSILS